MSNIVKHGGQNQNTLIPDAIILWHSILSLGEQLLKTAEMQHLTSFPKKKNNQIDQNLCSSDVAGVFNVNCIYLNVVSLYHLTVQNLHLPVFLSNNCNYIKYILKSVLLQRCRYKDMHVFA